MTAPSPLSPVRLHLGQLRGVSGKALGLRFIFGAAASGVAGTVGRFAGAHAGGVFLAAPAILMATLTLIADEDGVGQAQEDVHGASLAGAALGVFGAVIALTITRWPVSVSLMSATLAWFVTALVGFRVDRALLRRRDRRLQRAATPARRGRDLLA